MRKLLRLSVLALAAMFASGAYAQLPEDVGLGDEQNVLKQQGINAENAYLHFWTNQVGESVMRGKKPGDDSQDAKNWYSVLVDGILDQGDNSGNFNAVQSNWSAYEEPNYLYVYLNEAVGGPLVAHIQRWAGKKDNHVIEMTVFGSNDEDAKDEVTDKGWDEIATVSVSNPGADKSGLTDIFTPSRPYKFFRFRTDKTDHATRMWSFHMAEFGLYSLDPESMGNILLSFANGQYEVFAESDGGYTCGHEYYQYEDEAAFKGLQDGAKKIKEMLESGNVYSEAEANAVIEPTKACYEAYLASYKTFKLTEDGYYRLCKATDKNVCIVNANEYGVLISDAVNNTDSRQIWKMSNAEGDRIYIENAADGAVPYQSAGSKVMCGTLRVVEGLAGYKSQGCNLDFAKYAEDGVTPIVCLRATGGRYTDSDGNDNNVYATIRGNGQFVDTGDWHDDNSQFVLVKVDDAEAEKIIASSSHTAYSALQPLIFEAADLLDIAADADNCFGENEGNGLLSAASIKSNGGNGQANNPQDMFDENPQSYCYGREGNVTAWDHSVKFGETYMDIDLGKQYTGGLNVTYEHALAGERKLGFHVVTRWTIWGANDEALLANDDLSGWSLIDPDYALDFDHSGTTGNTETKAINLYGKGFRYLRWVSMITWSMDDWDWCYNSWQIAKFQLTPAKRLSAAQIEGDNAQALLVAVKAALEKNTNNATQADVEALKKAIEDFKLGFADPTALRALINQTQFLAAGASDEFVGEDAGLFNEAMDAEFAAVWDEANTYAANGSYSQDQLEYYFNMLTEAKGNVEDAAVMPDASKWYFLSFASEDLYEDNEWSKANCWIDGGNSLFDNMLSAESAEEGAKFFYSTDYDTSADNLSYFRFVENGDTYAIVNGCGKYLSLLSGLPRLSETPTYYNVIPVGYGQFIFKAEGVVLNGEVSNLTLDTAADGNCNTNAAFMLVDTGDVYDAISNIKDNKQKSNAIYSIDGKQVNDNFKGVVIKNGSKILNK